MMDWMTSHVFTFNLSLIVHFARRQRKMPPLVGLGWKALHLKYIYKSTQFKRLFFMNPPEQILITSHSFFLLDLCFPASLFKIYLCAALYFEADIHSLPHSFVYLFPSFLLLMREAEGIALHFRRERSIGANLDKRIPQILLLL